MDRDEARLADSLRLIDDRHMGRAHVIGTYIVLGDEPALVDPGPASTLANLEAGLQAHGLSFSDMRAILLTHIHLDHAGATGTIVGRWPHLRVYVHERGAPHIIAPERLINSAGRLYGERMQQLWGEINPVPEENVATLAGGETLALGGRRLRVFDTPGHARHHVVYLDEQTGGAFVGDVAGVRLPGASYVRPATPPPEIDLDAWQRSLDLLRDLAPSALYLTHFGPYDQALAHIEQYRERLVRWAEVVRESLECGEDDAAQVARLNALAESELVETGALRDNAGYQQAMPVEQNWLGLVRYWRKRQGA